MPRSKKKYPQFNKVFNKSESFKPRFNGPTFNPTFGRFNAMLGLSDVGVKPDLHEANFSREANFSSRIF